MAVLITTFLTVTVTVVFTVCVPRLRALDTTPVMLGTPLTALLGRATRSRVLLLHVILQVAPLRVVQVVGTQFTVTPLHVTLGQHTVQHRLTTPTPVTALLATQPL